MFTNFPINFLGKKTQCMLTKVCNKWMIETLHGIKLCQINEFLCEKILQFFTFIFYYCLF